MVKEVDDWIGKILDNLLGINPDSQQYNTKVEELELCFLEWMGLNQEP